MKNQTYIILLLYCQMIIEHHGGIWEIWKMCEGKYKLKFLCDKRLKIESESSFDICINEIVFKSRDKQQIEHVYHLVEV